MVAESEDDLVLENSDSDIDDPSYINHVPAHAIPSSDEDEFTNTTPVATAHSDSDSNDEGLLNRGPSSSTSTKSSSKCSKPKAKPITWFSGRDNALPNNWSQFSGRFQVNVQAESPLDMFMYLFPQDLLADIVYQTNLYACQNGKDNLRLSVEELKVFLGIVIAMTYIRYPRIRHYWSSENGLRMSLIADAMSVNRFENIRKYLHFIDNTTIPHDNTDKTIKIRPILTKLHETFHKAADNEEYQSVDEMMIPFKGRSSIKQYLPKKPQKWGYKMWCRAGVSGYIYCFELFQGAAGNRGAISDCGASGDVILRLTHDLHQSNCKIYADNYFSNIPLILKLKALRIWYVGTTRKFIG